MTSFSEYLERLNHKNAIDPFWLNFIVSLETRANNKKCSIDEVRVQQLKELKFQFMETYRDDVNLINKYFSERCLQAKIEFNF